jgi:hypothetical protein
LRDTGGRGTSTLVKRSTWFAAILGVLLVGGGIYAVTRGTSSSTATSSTSSSTTPSTQATPGATPTERDSTPGSTTTSSSSASPATVHDPDKGGATVNRPISPEAAARAEARGADPAAAMEAPKRLGETQVRQVPRDPNVQLSSEDEAIVRQKRFKQTITKAACTAPDIGERLAQMPAADGQQLIERCAAVGVTITPAKK